MPNTLITINESFEDMVVGRNSTLSYIVAALELGENVYIHNLPKNPLPRQAFPADKNAEVRAIQITANSAWAKELIAAYKSENEKYLAVVVDELQKQKADARYPFGTELLKVAKQKINQGRDLTQLKIVNISLSEITNMVQRLEPMKAPFPPEGVEDFDVALTNMKSALPGVVFTAPIGISDKENLQINDDLKKLGREEIATPTTEFTLDGNFMAAFEPMFAKSVEIFEGSKPRIVLKPKDSAQSCGVCAIELDEAGHNLASLQKMTIEELSHQAHKFKTGLSADEMKQMAEILLYAQRIVTDQTQISEVSAKTAGEISREEIRAKARELYNGQILAQPFLQGVKHGDIRANIIKDENGNFALDGYTYRASARKEGDHGFTTCYTTGAAVSAPITFLSEVEQQNLAKNTALLLELLNGSYREKYSDVREIGVDFVPVGDKAQNVVLGEINHACPALGPISEVLKEAVRNVNYPETESTYDGGINYAKKALSAAMTQQHSAGSTQGGTRKKSRLETPSTTFGNSDNAQHFASGSKARRGNHYNTGEAYFGNP